MLALSRRKDEAIVVNGNIEIRVLDIQEGKVRLGISAPKDVTIYREEIYLQISNSNTEASHTSQDALAELKKLLGERG